MLRNQWTTCSGFGGRLAPDSLVAIDRITQNTNVARFMLQKPGLSISGAKYLAGLRPKIIGIDSFGLEIPGSVDYEVNHFLFQQDIIILEGLVNLSKVIEGAWLEAYPLPITNVEGTPCRAIVKIATD
jgi:arylformamidase